MKKISFNEFKKDLERIRKMEDLPGGAPSEKSPASPWWRSGWMRLRAFARSHFQHPPPRPTVHPSEDLVRLLQVMEEEPRIYHLFMYLATSPLEVRRAMLQKLASQIQSETQDEKFVELVNQLQDPRVFEATYRTIQEIRS